MVGIVGLDSRLRAWSAPALGAAQGSHSLLALLALLSDGLWGVWIKKKR